MLLIIWYSSRCKWFFVCREFFLWIMDFLYCIDLTPWTPWIVYRKHEVNKHRDKRWRRCFIGILLLVLSYFICYCMPVYLHQQSGHTKPFTQYSLSQWIILCGWSFCILHFTMLHHSILKLCGTVSLTLIRMTKDKDLAVFKGLILKCQKFKKGPSWQGLI
jgi:hypothetical protein